MDKALFIGNQGRRLDKHSLVDLFKRYKDLSGISRNKKFSIHSLRHTFATQLLRKNANLVSIQQLMGHKSIESTYVYMHVTGKELRESINVL
jgi:integrase/recombinase XerD